MTMGHHWNVPMDIGDGRDLSPRLTVEVVADHCEVYPCRARGVALWSRQPLSDSNFSGRRQRSLRPE